MRIGIQALRPHLFVLVGVSTITVLASCSLLGHDFWIEPSDFTPSSGQAVAIRLLVGDNFDGGLFPRDPAHIDRFFSLGPAGEQTVAGPTGRLARLQYPRLGGPGYESGSLPAGFIHLEQPGLYIVGYSSHPSTSHLGSEQFERHLGREGLQEALEERQRRGWSEKEAKEFYVRCAKSLLAAGHVSTLSGDARLGLTLELVAQKNPYTLTDGEELPVRVYYRGEPLAGARVTAMNRKQPFRKFVGYSNDQGLAYLPIPQEGVWMLKCIHMVPASQGSAAEWQSYWASLTFASGDY